MEKLVSLSAQKAQKFYGLVYPRDVWWVRLGLAVENIFERLRRSHYRAYVHSGAAVEVLLNSSGLKHRSYRQTLLWQVVVYTR